MLRQVKGAGISSSVGGDAKGSETVQGAKQLLIVSEGTRISSAVPLQVRPDPSAADYEDG